MQIKIFTMPLGGDEAALEEMNHFLRANKIIDIKKDLASINGNNCWTFCITYMLGKPSVENNKEQRNGKKVDYKEILPEDVFARFSLLRKIRKQIADEESIPAYAVFTDAELSEIAKLQELNTTTLFSIPGIGKKKIEKYLDAIMIGLSDVSYNEEGRILD